MSNIAASLGLPQQKRFQKFLVTSRSPYTFVSAPRIPSAPRAVGAGTPPPRLDQFVVITPDTCTIATIKINMENVRRNVVIAQQQLRTVDERTHRLIKEISAQSRMRKTPNPAFSIFSGSDYFSIKVENNALEPSPDAMPFEVVARAPRAVKFRYEMKQMPNMQNFFNEDSEIALHFFRTTPPPAAGYQAPGSIRHRGIDLDSVISAPRDRKSQPQIYGKKKRYNNPFEL